MQGPGEELAREGLKELAVSVARTKLSQKTLTENPAHKPALVRAGLGEGRPG